MGRIAKITDMPVRKGKLILDDSNLEKSPALQNSCIIHQIQSSPIWNANISDILVTSSILWYKREFFKILSPLRLLEKT